MEERQRAKINRERQDISDTWHLITQKMNLKEIFSHIKSSNQKWLKAIDKKPLYSLITPSLSAILILINQHSTSDVNSQLGMNIILLLVFCVELLAAIASSQNVTKIFWLIGASAAFFEAIIYNFYEQGLDFPITSAYAVFNGLCGVWTGIFIPVFIYLIVVCIRVIRWTQQEWEKVNALRQEERKNRLEAYICKQKIKRAFRIESYGLKDLLKKLKIEKKKQHQEYEIKAEADKQENRLEEQKVKEEQKRKIK